MAKRISDLTAATSIVGVDLIPMVDTGLDTTKKITFTNFQSSILIAESQVTAGTSYDDQSLSLGNIRVRKAQVQTTDDTPTTLLSYTMLDESVAAFDVVITAASRTNVTSAARYKRSVVYRRTGAGIATIVGAIELGTDQETDAGWDTTITTDGANAVQVQVTGALGSNINWTCELRIQETLAT